MTQEAIRTRTQAIAWAALGWVALTSPLTAAAADKFEPFVAGSQIAEILDFNVDANCQPASSGTESTAMGQIRGSGLATSGIGAFTLSSVDCVRAANPYFQPPYAFNSTAFKLTTRNGDQIVASYSGTAVVDPATMLLVLKGTFQFTGGTGKYRNVRGGGRLDGAEDISGFPMARGFVTLTGTIAH